MSQLIRIAGPDGEPRASVLFVHGLGGHAYDTWRLGAHTTEPADDPTFWPLWLARDCEKLAVYLVGYEAPVSRLRGTAMHLTDQATNILARVLAEPALAHGPLILIGHSLGGLVIKQLLRTAESTSRYQAGAGDLMERIEKVAFLATPHSGAGLASLGDRLRILVRPSVATASLVHNDPNLRDLNNWYRDWANGRGIAHLILTETASARILSMIVPPDSADPGLANVRSLAIGTNHVAICKPSDDASDIYVFVRDFVDRPAERPKQLLETKLDALPDAIVTKLMASLDARGATSRAAEAGIERQTILQLARRLKPDEVIDFDRAIVELTAAVEVAIGVTEKGTHGSNFDDPVDAVLTRITEKTRAGDLEGAIRDADRGFAEWERMEAERRKTSLRNGIALLEAGLEQDILGRNATGAARRVGKIVALEYPDDSLARFAAVRERQDVFHVRGRDKGINLDLLVAIEIARLALGATQDTDERRTALNDLGSSMYVLGEREGGTARLDEAVAAYRQALSERARERAPLGWAMIQNNLGVALSALGERESSTAHLEEAITAHREALKEYSRERAPLDWAVTQNNLGNALKILGERESATAKLEEATAAYREALKERTRERVPLQWAMTQNNLGTVLQRLGERESDTGRLDEAVRAYREALKERTREGVPLDWAMTQNNLGNALSILGERESGTVKLEEAVAAYRDALKEYTRERVPLDWAMTQNNLGYALAILGERESGTAKLEEAVAAYREALKEYTRERVPLDWAMTVGNEGVALMHLGERRSDATTADSALRQINMAFETMRDGGHAPNAAFYERHLPRAQALCARLRGQ